MRFWLMCFCWLAAAGAFWFLVGLGMILVAAESGPACPGADPSWIGWCSEAPRN